MWGTSLRIQLGGGSSEKSMSLLVKQQKVDSAESGAWHQAKEFKVPRTCRVPNVTPSGHL